jgi:hypothetical protein
MGVGFFLISVAIAWAGLRFEQQSGGGVSQAFWGVFAALALVGTVFIATRKPPVHQLSVTLREPDDLTRNRPHFRAHPYRSALRRAARIVAAPVSGAKMAALVVLAMVTIGLALPGLLKLPRLVEVEVVAAAFWLLWGCVGSVLLYRGFRVANDHVLARPRPPWRPSRASNRPVSDENRKWDFCGCFNVEGILFLLLLLVAFTMAWLLVEVVIPFVLFVVYCAVRAALAAVANDDHDCEGHLGRALAWGFAWSTVYSLPVAGILGMVRLLTR